MSQVLLQSAQEATGGPFRVAAPFAGDVVSRALHNAYDDGLDLPEDIRSLLDCLDQFE